MEKQKNIFQQKKKIKLQRQNNEIEVSDLPGKELKIMVIKIFTEVRKTMHEQRISTERKYNKGSNRNCKTEEYNN